MNFDKSLLIRFMNFSTPSTKIDYSKFLPLLELLFCDIKPNSEPSFHLVCIKTNLQDTGFIS